MTERDESRRQSGGGGDGDGADGPSGDGAPAVPADARGRRPPGDAVQAVADFVDDLVEGTARSDRAGEGG